jgi:hypothetical protein
MLYATNFRKSEDILGKCRIPTGCGILLLQAERSRPENNATSAQLHLNQPSLLNLLNHGGVQ